MSLLGQFRSEQLKGAGESWEDKGKRGLQEVRSVEVSPQQVKSRLGESFLAYPVGEWESRHQRLEEEYRSYLQNTYKNRPKSRTPEPVPAARTITRRTKDVQSLYIVMGPLRAMSSAAERRYFKSHEKLSTFPLAGQEAAPLCATPNQGY